MSDTFVPTVRTRVRRLPARARYDVETIHAILDEGRTCHVGFVSDGQPFVLPTLYVRSGDHLYVHGSSASRLVRTLDAGADVCLTVTLVDGFVLARSAMHHAMNYRSVVVFGRARLVTDRDEKLKALRLLTDHLVRDRWSEVRPPTDAELVATAVLTLSIDEASAKVRTGPPVDDEEDYALPIWAGVVPVRVSVGEAVDDGRVQSDIAPIDTARIGIGPSIRR